MGQPALRAGDLDRRITIETPTASVDAMGGPVETYAALATVWAGFRPKHGREALAAGATVVAAEADAVFTIRWRSDVTTRQRIAFDGEAWDILSVVEYGRRVGLELVAKVRRLEAA